MLAALAALFGGVGFDTLDVHDVHRVRSAVFVWRYAVDAVSRSHTATVAAIFIAALAATVAGSFVLVWLAAVVDNDDDRGESVAVSSLRSLTSHVDRWGVDAHVAPAVVAAGIALAGYIALRMGLFAPVRVAGIANTFASFDHPFHIARAATFLNAIASGHSLRWVAGHQGGYPAEFYPFGFPAFEAAVWLMTGARLPVPIVHRTAVILLFVAPAPLFYAMARRDGWPAIVALAAFALHVAVPGDMWSGGYGELVLVGLVANVSAALLVVAAMVAAGDGLASGSRRALALAGAAAAAAIWCNPRSGVGLAVCCGAAAIAARTSWRLRIVRSIQIAAVAALLSAPELVSLIRFHDLYYFIRYTGYGSSLDYAAASIEAVSVPAVAFALAGVAAAGFARRHAIARTATLALLGYVAATLMLTFAAGDAVEQLETTRLMPVQRLLTIYLAAVGVHVVATTVAARWPARRHTALALQAIAIAAVLVIWLGPERAMPFWSRGLYPVQSSGVPEMATFQQVITAADAEAPAGTAILIVGNPMNGHQQLWAPARVDRLFFYDDWMWYWHQHHRGPYDPARTSKYDPARLGEVFTRAYLERNAIGAVVAGAAAQPAADSAPDLRRLFGGTFGLYGVINPVPVVTLGGLRPRSVRIANGRVAADGVSSGGDALIRQNWFPRWRATVNGRPAAISRTDDGYMRVAVPAGPVTITLDYALDRFDIAARLAAIAGIALLALAVMRSPAARQSTSAAGTATSTVQRRDTSTDGRTPPPAAPT